MENRIIDPADVRSALESDYSDAYKALNGVRPRRDLSAYGDEDLYVEIQALYADAERETALKRSQEAEKTHRQASGEFRMPTSGPGWQLIPA